MSVKPGQAHGNKRNELSSEHIAQITRMYEEFAQSDRSLILSNDAFRYLRITVDRPLRVRYEITNDGLDQLTMVGSVSNLDPSDRDTLIATMRGLIGEVYTTANDFENALAPVYAKLNKAPAAMKKAVVSACMVRDPNAEPVQGKKGFEADTSLRDSEQVPFDETVEDFMTRNVLPFAPDARVDENKTRVGYEIPFTRYFYRYVPPRPLDEIDAEIRGSQQRILQLLAEVTE